MTKDAVKTKRSDWHTFWHFALLCFYLSVRQEPCSVCIDIEDAFSGGESVKLTAFARKHTLCCWPGNPVAALQEEQGQKVKMVPQPPDWNPASSLQGLICTAPAAILTFLFLPTDTFALQEFQTGHGWMRHTVLGSNCWYLKSTEMSLWHDWPWSPKFPTSTIKMENTVQFPTGNGLQLLGCGTQIWGKEYKHQLIFIGWLVIFISGFSFRSSSIYLVIFPHSTYFARWVRLRISA